MSERRSESNYTLFVIISHLSCLSSFLFYFLSLNQKVVEKTVVTVKIGETNVGKVKNEGPPSDFWSWRKYGQKPIKGSPYPRGYYKCSTSKGCSAKKQVERSKNDASVLIVTYTSTHNHPPPAQNSTILPPQKQPQQEQEQEQEQDQEDKEQETQEQQIEEKETKTTNSTADDHDQEEPNFHYIQSPIISSSQEVEAPFTRNLDQNKTSDTLGVLLEEEPLSYSRHQHQLMSCFSKPIKSDQENDFFDELEELPTSSSFTSFMRSHFSDEGILIVPS
ncbi:hypothetical protein UlMin_030769 [Ulmus minor]